MTQAGGKIYQSWLGLLKRPLLKAIILPKETSAFKSVFIDICWTQIDHVKQSGLEVYFLQYGVEKYQLWQSNNLLKLVKKIFSPVEGFHPQILYCYLKNQYQYKIQSYWQSEVNVTNLLFTHLKVWGFHLISYCLVGGIFFNVQGKDKVFFFVWHKYFKCFCFYFIFTPYIFPLFGTGKIELVYMSYYGILWHKDQPFYGMENSRNGLFQSFNQAIYKYLS